MSMFVPDVLSDAWNFVDETVTAVVKFAKNMVTYEVQVFTGDKRGAGTDANVSLTLVGSNGSSGKRALKEKYKNLFERGQTDTFKMEMKNLGELEKVVIEHDGTGFGAGWYVDQVRVKNMKTGLVQLFPCNEWLDPKKGDCKTCRELYPE